MNRLNLNVLFNSLFNLTLISIIILFYLNQCSAQSCYEMEIEADRSFKKILMIGERIVIPRNEEQLNNHCKEGKSALLLASRFGSCLKPFPRQVLSILVRGAKRALKVLCVQKKNETLNNLRCLTGDNIYIFYKLLEDGFKRIDYIVEAVADQEMIPHLCCVFHLMYDELLQTISLECQNEQSGAAALIKGIVDNIVKEVIDLACTKYSTLESCERQLPYGLMNLRYANRKPSQELHGRFLIGPILNITERLIN